MFAVDFNDKKDTGDYRIVLNVYKVDAYNNIIEQYHNEYTYITVPENFSADVFVSTYTPNSTEENNNKIPNTVKEAANQAGNFADKFKSESTYFLALGLLIPPLLFALAIKLFTEAEIGEDSLKNTFYMQCYYFTPISLAIWATWYGFYFFTADIFFHSDAGNLIMLLPPLLAAIWFITVETNVIANERHISKLKAIVIVALCLLVILLAAYLFLSRGDADLQDSARKFAIWLYPIASFGLLAAFSLAWFRQLRAQKTKLTVVQWVVILTFLIVIMCCLGISVMGGSNTYFVPPTAEATLLNQPTVTTIAPIVAPTEVAATQALTIDTPVPQDQKFYTEDFSGDLQSWIPSLISGAQSQVKFSPTNGNLNIQLTPDNDQKTWVNLINNAYTYTDVQLELTTTNNGNNANGVDLICRYSDNGWYEFSVSNSGLYSIYVFDANKQLSQLATGGSSAIKAGSAQNVYTAICQGHDLTLYINDKPVKSITDTSLSDGNIGIAVSSPDGLPVDVDLESLTISTPQ